MEAWLHLAASEDGRWRPGIGDPSVYGWVTVAAYTLAAGLCLIAWHRAKQLDLPRGLWRLRLLWLGLAAAMVLLAINKQLDVQSLITQVGKDLAQKQGWYEERRAVQQKFVYGVAAAGGLGVILTAFLLWGHWRRTAVALVGIAVTVGFVTIRAASFHKFDHFIGRSVAGVRFNVLLELAGIGLVCLGTLMNLRPTRADD